MPTPAHALARARLSRRGALGTGVAALGALLGACTGATQSTRPAGSSPRTTPEASGDAPDPDVATAADALAAQASMLLLLRGTVVRHPRLAEALEPAVLAHEAHAALLSDAVPEDAASAAPSPSAGGSVGRRTGVPRKVQRAVEDVVRAEQALAATIKQQALRAESGSFARVLGSIAASAAQHAARLSAGADGAAG